MFVRTYSCVYLMLYVYFDKMLNSVVVTFLFSLSLPPTFCLPLHFSSCSLLCSHAHSFFLFLIRLPSLGTGNYFSLFTFSNISLFTLALCVAFFLSVSPMCPVSLRHIRRQPLLWLYVYIFVIAVLTNEWERE